MKKLMLIVMFGAAGLLPAGLRAGGVELKSITPDAEWVLHFDFARFKQGRVGGLMLDEMTYGPHAHKIGALVAMLQFDPREDLESMTLFGKGLDNEAVLVARANVNGDHLVTLLKANEDYRVHDVSGRQIHEWKDDHGMRRRSFGAVIDDKWVVIAPSRELVTSVLNQAAGVAPALAADSKLAKLLPEEPVAFFVAAVNFEDMPELNAEAEILRAARSGSLVVHEQGDEMRAELKLMTDTSENALNLQRMAQGLLAFAAMAGNEQPELARLAQRVRVSSENNLLRCSMDLPTQMVVDELKKELEKNEGR